MLCYVSVEIIKQSSCLHLVVANWWSLGFSAIKAGCKINCFNQSIGQFHSHQALPKIMCILYPSPSGWARRMPHDLWPSVCAAYIYKCYTHTLTRGKHTHTHTHTHTLTCTQACMLAHTCTHSKWMTHSRGWITWGSRMSTEGTLHCMLSMPVTHAAKHSPCDTLSAQH